MPGSPIIRGFWLFESGKYLAIALRAAAENWKVEAKQKETNEKKKIGKSIRKESNYNNFN